jgi:hypothetical protein
MCDFFLRGFFMSGLLPGLCMRASCFNRKLPPCLPDNHQYEKSEPVSGEFLAVIIKKRATCIRQHKHSLPECLLTLLISRRSINL